MSNFIGDLVSAACDIAHELKVAVGTGFTILGSRLEADARARVECGPQWLTEFEEQRDSLEPSRLPYPDNTCGKHTGNCSNRCLLPEGHSGDCDDNPDMHPDAVYARLYVDQARKSSAAVSAAADPSPADNHHASRGAGDEGPEGASAIPPAAPSGHLADAWYCQDCGVLNLVQALTDPGEVSAPSLGGQVLEDDLAAHIMGDFVSGQDVDPLTATLIDALSSRIARCLLADFHITRK